MSDKPEIKTTVVSEWQPQPRPEPLFPYKPPRVDGRTFALDPSSLRIVEVKKANVSIYLTGTDVIVEVG